MYFPPPLPHYPPSLQDLLWSYSSLDDDGNGRRNRSSVADTVSDRMLTRPFHTFPCPQGYCRCTVQETEGNRRCRFMSREDAPNDQCQCNRTGTISILTCTCSILTQYTD